MWYRWIWTVHAPRSTRAPPVSLAAAALWASLHHHNIAMACQDKSILETIDELEQESAGLVKQLNAVNREIDKLEGEAMETKRTIFEKRRLKRKLEEMEETRVREERIEFKVKEGRYVPDEDDEEFDVYCGNEKIEQSYPELEVGRIGKRMAYISAVQGEGGVANHMLPQKVIAWIRNQQYVPGYISYGSGFETGETWKLQSNANIYIASEVWSEVPQRDKKWLCCESGYKHVYIMSH